MNDALEPVQEYFGSRASPYSFDQWLVTIDRVVAAGRRRYLSGHHNLHSLYMSQRDPEMQRFYRRCDDWYIDGVPVRLILAGFGVRTSAHHRFTLMDHFEAFLGRAEERRWRVFYLGSAPDVVERARRLFASRFPALHIELQHGYLEEDSGLVARINDYRPDVLLVGMGVPRQEHWIIGHLDDVDAAFVTHCGGSLDYIAGGQARPPAWLSRVGLGWLYRLIHDPHRLWRRYLVEPWALLPSTLRQWRRQRAFRK